MRPAPGNAATTIGALIAAALAAALIVPAAPAAADTPVLPYATSALATPADISAAALTASAFAAPTARSELPPRVITMSIGAGQLVRLARPMTGLFIADDKVADVQVKSSTQIYLFAKTAGETSLYATDRAGNVVFSTTVRVGNNLTGIGGMLKIAMPEADITVTPLGGGMVLLTGTVLSPRDAEEAQNLAELYTGKTVQVLNHLKIATPQQVGLQVKIAEVSRSVTRNIGVNILSRDGSGGFLFGVAQGDAGTIKNNISGGLDENGVRANGVVYTAKALAGTTLSAAGRLFGMDLLSTLQLFENNGLVTTLAEPNLIALSGETATFLAGGEIPIPQSAGLGATSVVYKQYGVSLAFTPTVMSGGRIMLRVRPEVSQISDAGSVKLDDFTIPALSTRRAETTIELGSGQSFVIGGLLMNSHNNSTSKAPILGDLPIIGALFRSNGFKKDETELLIVVTPYLVKPVDANSVALPTDGYRAASTIDRVLGGVAHQGTSGERRPTPSGTATVGK